MSQAVLDDDQFVQAFERCTMPVEMFHHREHIRLAWIYLRSMDFEAARHRMGASILRFATRHGAARKYHATITVAWMYLVRAASDADSGVESFEQLLNEHPELLSARTLELHYSKEALASEDARERWIGPDRRALPGWAC